MLIRFSFAWIPTTQFFVNEREPDRIKLVFVLFHYAAKVGLPSANRRILCNTFLMMTGLNTFNYIRISSRQSECVATRQMNTHLKLSTCSCYANRSLVSNNLRSNHSQSLALGRVDLSRHDTATRLILRQVELTQPTPRAGSEVPNVVRDLHERARNDVQRAVRLNQCIVRGERFEL